MIRGFKNSKKTKFLRQLFRSSKKTKFVNRLKYGDDKKPVYTTKAMTDALMIGDTEKAEEILKVLLERKTTQLMNK
jgi:hypothetical protein